MKRLILAFFLFPAIAGNAQKLSLQLHLAVGSTYSQKQQSNMEIVQTVNGNENTSRLNTVSVSSYFVKAAHDSVYELMVRFENISTKITAGSTVMEFSSDGTKQDITSLLMQAVVNKPFLVIMTTKGRVMHAYPDSIFSSAIDQFAIGEDQKKMIKEQMVKNFGSSSVKGSFEMLSAIYPQGAVRKDQSWKTTTSLQAFTMMDLDATYTLKAVNKNSCDIHGEVQMISQKIDSATLVNGLPMYYDLSGQMTSDMTLDKKTGWINSAKLHQSIKGVINVKDSEQTPGGMSIPTTVTSEITLTDK